MPVQTTKPLLAGPGGRPLRIASIGECMVEMAPAERKAEFKQAFAGDTLNTLWYLRQLRPDWTARYVTRVGRDQISDDMVAMMDGAGIDTGHIQRDAERTVGLYLITLSDGERSFAYWRSQSAAKRLADEPKLMRAALQDVDVVFFSGITLAILEAPARAALLAELAAARDAGKTTVFDPNLRPRLWPDAALMRDAIMAGAAVSDMILPSFEEEALHFSDTDIAATCARYLGQGASTVVVKDGAEAVHYSHNGQVGSVRPEPVPQVVDTTSAGDSFNAGLMAGLGQFAAIDAAISMASRVARQVIGQKGALVRLDLADVGQRQENAR
jgi:2-dehydro-3-deoxygluconokinase